MKRTLLLAAAAVVGVPTAHAQPSSVVIFGNMDAKIAVGRGDGGTTYGVDSGGDSGSRFGVRGREDLGGGLAASFWLEAQLDSSTGVGTATNTNNTPTGTSTGSGLQWNRRSTVSLHGNWGELRAGRDYTPQFWNVNQMDPFLTNGVAANTMLLYTDAGSVAARASNSLAYHLPANLGGVFGQATLWRGELAPGATEDDGNGGGFRLGYRTTAFDAAVAVAKTNYNSGDITTANIGVGLNLPGVRLTGAYQEDDVGERGTGKGYLIGAKVPVGAGFIRASYSAYKRVLAGNPEHKKAALGYVHTLSKRTIIYATLAHAENKGPAALALNRSPITAGGDATGFDLGIRHLF